MLSLSLNLVVFVSQLVFTLHVWESVSITVGVLFTLYLILNSLRRKITMRLFFFFFIK